jgi:lysophospholipase L1-like esterase
VALYLPGRAPCTCHTTGAEVVRVSPPGNHIGEAFASVAAESAGYRAFLTGVEVDDASRGPVIAAFGDSITDGARSTPGANRRWPDRLAERLAGAAVVNAGISGNRLLGWAEDRPWAGEAALARFDRDVLSIPGLTHVVILEGVNDLGRGGASPPSAEELILAYSQLIDRAHGHGAKAIGGTILPYEGAGYFRPEGEAVRQAVNRWIRTSGAFDGVIDFDAAMRDPAAPGKLRADLHSGDWLHPNDAGYRVMGDAVDLKLFR